jgi:hypothetical protein
MDCTQICAIMYSLHTEVQLTWPENTHVPLYGTVPKGLGHKSSELLKQFEEKHYCMYVA